MNYSFRHRRLWLPLADRQTFRIARKTLYEGEISVARHCAGEQSHIVFTSHARVFTNGHRRGRRLKKTISKRISHFSHTPITCPHSSYAVARYTTIRVCHWSSCVGCNNNIKYLKNYFAGMSVATVVASVVIMVCNIHLTMVIIARAYEFIIKYLIKNTNTGCYAPAVDRRHTWTI